MANNLAGPLLLHETDFLKIGCVQISFFQPNVSGV